MAKKASRENPGNAPAGRSPARSPRKAIPASVALGPEELRVRMYRVGFGDCFLLSLPTGGRGGAAHEHVLVDCGVHPMGNLKMLAAAVEDVRVETGGSLAAVIATHAHQDHIAGFGDCAAAFASFTVGEVWMPWTWNSEDPAAAKIQKKQADLVRGLTTYYSAPGAKAPDSRVVNALANLAPNRTAIASLKAGLGAGGVPRYLEAGQVLRQAAGISGLTVRVLGPPRSEAFLKHMDPPAGQAYLRMAGGGAAAGAGAPFPGRWRVSAGSDELESVRLTPEERDALRASALGSLDDLAFTIDQARNNESVVALFSFRGQNLLFPGDAEYNNWRSWLEGADAGEILGEITFLKVAHHGSVNATPKSALERMSDGAFAAMVSTQSSPWESIPRAPLMMRLSEKTRQRIVRSDWIPLPDAPSPRKDAKPARPRKLADCFRKGEFWIDYVVSLPDPVGGGKPG